MHKNQLYILLILIPFLFLSCRDYTPKPKGHLYFEDPETGHYTLEQFSRFKFLLSEKTSILNERDSLSNQWFDICYPSLNATIYCSYIPISSKNFAQIDEKSRNFVYFHLRKAEQFGEQSFENPEQNVFGVIYRIEGEVASPIQFVLTDSTSSFFRGALYFDQVFNQDSIAPVIHYLDKEIQTIIESFQWKK